jgi:hypothetical protein
MTREQWYRQKEGYYVRYLPDNYKETKIQVYVPGNIIDDANETGNYIVFDPASRVIFPANSNAQRLGIGGPVVDIVKSVIKNIGNRKPVPKPKTPPPASKTPQT